MERGEEIFYGKNLISFNKNSPFSNVNDSVWEPGRGLVFFKFTVDDICFHSVEQYLWYRKAVLFNDQKRAKKIKEAYSASKARRLGKHIRNADETMWEAERPHILLKGLLAKFSQNEKLKHKLKETSSKHLVHAHESDLISGIGLGLYNWRVMFPKYWRGKNLLGEALMKVREILRKEETPQET